MPKKITEDMKDRAVALYDRVRNTQKVANALGISVRSVQRALADRGVDAPKGKQPVDRTPHAQAELDFGRASETVSKPALPEADQQILDFCHQHNIDCATLEVLARRPELNLSNVTAMLAKLRAEDVGLVMHNVSLTRIQNQIDANQAAAQQRAEKVLGDG